MSLRIIMALAAGMAFLVILDAVFHLAHTAKPRLQAQRRFLALGQLLSRAALVLYPSFVKAFHWQSTKSVKCQHCMSSFKAA